jgi:hypothetical protein
MSGLGKQHESKPVTMSDKIMSKRHHAHRAEINEMKSKGKSKEKILKKSIKYNKAHAQEHEKALKEAVKALEKRKKDE